MTIRRTLIATLASAAALAAALTFVLRANAVPPTLTAVNSGGVPLLNSNKCDFTLRFEICKITVTNQSTFNVKITELEVSPPNGRYSIITSGCQVGNQLAANGGSCTDEVKLLIDKPACPPQWLNGYRIVVEEVGVPTNKTVKIVFLKVS